MDKITRSLYMVALNLRRKIRTPKSVNIIKSILRNNKTIGKNFKIRFSTELNPKITLELKDNVEIDQNGRIVIYIHPKYQDLKQSKLKTGNNVWIGPGAHIDCSGTVEIGNNSTISAKSEILTHEHINLNRKNEHEVIKSVKIGNNVVIAEAAMISAGVTIGNNCIIGAHSLVTNNVKDNSIVMGNPARVIGQIKEEERK